MALVLPGGGITDITGSIGGTIFQRCKFGVTIRNRTRPLDPLTKNNTKRRAVLQTTSRMWSNNITESDRAQWNAFALLNPQTNPFGQIGYLSGMNWFVKLNAEFVATGGSIIATPPASGTYPAGTTVTFVADSSAGGSLVTTWDVPEWEGTPEVRCFMTPNQNAGVSYANSRMRFIGQVDASTGTHDWITQWQARFPGLAILTGKKLLGILIFVDADTNAPSAGTFISDIAA